MKQHIIITEDGSHSVSVPEWDVSYHSKHGALQESKHIFIDAGLQVVAGNKNNISIFEMGFGTGLNALLTLLETTITPIKIYYEAVELYPLDISLFSQLNYTAMLQRQDAHAAFMQLHLCEWDNTYAMSENFSLLKRKGSIENIVFDKQFDIVYFDAFAPQAQPELWTVEVFKKLYHAIRPGGLLLTYCSKGVVRRAMQEAGFYVEKIAGPKGKREVVRASVPPETGR